MLNILYRDQYLVAIDKPAGLLVHRSAIDKHESQNAMHLLRDQLGQWVYPLHRLDKPTSGILLFAFDEIIARTMGEYFEQGNIQKSYLAIVRGFIAEKGVIEHALRPIADFKSQRQKVAEKAPQHAVTHFERIGTLELDIAVDKYPSARYSLVKLSPKTGRKHQLRRHLKHISHPIIGDPKYGKSRHNRFFASHFLCPRLLLAAVGVSFDHPVTQQPITINADLSGQFAEVAAAFH